MPVDARSPFIALVGADDANRDAISSALVASGAAVHAVASSEALSDAALQDAAAIFVSGEDDALASRLRALEARGGRVPAVVPLAATDRALAAAMLSRVRALEAELAALVDGAPLIDEEPAVEFRPIEAFVGPSDDGPVETPILDQGGANPKVVALVLVALLVAIGWLILSPEPPPTEEELAQQAWEQRQETQRGSLELATHVVDRARLIASTPSNPLTAGSCENLVAREAWDLAQLPCARSFARDPSTARLYAQVLVAQGELARAQTLLRLRLIDAPQDREAWHALFDWGRAAGDLDTMLLASERFLSLEGTGVRAEAMRRQRSVLEQGEFPSPLDEGEAGDE